MKPVLTPEQMAAADQASSEPVEVLIERAGFAVARAGIELMGGTYGRRVVVVYGPGNNGRDGLVAARLLRRRGATVLEIAASEVADLPSGQWAPFGATPPDLVIDAAFGTGFRGTYRAPNCGRVPVLAVDIASGIDGLTGRSSGRPSAATATVTFAALKPGLLFADGLELSGPVSVAEIGLDLGPDATRCAVVDRADVRSWFRAAPRSAHKWHRAVLVVGGSHSMMGAPVLAARGAQAVGASYVRVGSPGQSEVRGAPVESVSVPLPVVGWQRVVLEETARVRAVAVGPGLGRDDAARAEVLAVLSASTVGVVVDGDALWAISEHRGRMGDCPTVLTPHDGEFLQLTGRPVGDDRVEAARYLAAERRCVVLLKGPTTVVAEPPTPGAGCPDASGRVRIVTAGDQRLATAGTGDVLSGVIAALLAAGWPPLEAAAGGAQIHGEAGRRCAAVGTVAGDVAAHLSEVASELSVEPLPTPDPNHTPNPTSAAERDLIRGGLR